MNHLSGAPLQGRLPALLVNIRLDWKSMPIGPIRKLRVVKVPEAVFLVVCDPSMNEL